MTSAWGPLTMWTVYDHPRDFPNNYVARKFLVDADGPRPQEQILVCPHVDKIRATLAADGFVCLPRLPDDDPTIIEVWV